MYFKVFNHLFYISFQTTGSNNDDSRKEAKITRTNIK